MAQFRTRLEFPRARVLLAAALFLIAAVTLMSAMLPTVAATSPVYVPPTLTRVPLGDGTWQGIIMGQSAINNCTVTFDGRYVILTNGTRSDNAVEISGFNGWRLIFYYDGYYINQQELTSGTVVFSYAPGTSNATLTSYLIGVNTTNNWLLIRAAPNIAPNLLNLFTVASITDFFTSFWGTWAYGIILMLPVTYYLAKKSIGGAAILMLFIGAVGITFIPSFRWIAYMVVAIAIVLLIYRFAWKSEQEAMVPYG